MHIKTSNIEIQHLTHHNHLENLRNKACVLALVSKYRQGMLYVNVKGVTSADLFAITQTVPDLPYN